MCSCPSRQHLNWDSDKFVLQEAASSASQSFNQAQPARAAAAFEHVQDADEEQGPRDDLNFGDGDAGPGHIEQTNDIFGPAHEFD